MLLGEELTYTLTVTNKGPSTGTGVTVIDALPAGVRFDSATTSRGDCNVVGDIIICDMGELASNDSAIATIVVKPLTTGIINNRARVTGNQADPNVANNTATQVTKANPAADLAVTMVHSPEPVLIGSNLTYTLIVTNHGPSDATGVTVRDFLPAGVSIVSATTSRGDCSVVGNIVICDMGELASSDSAIATIVVTRLTTGILNNGAGVTGDQADPNVANNTATQGTTANPEADLAVTMVDSPEPLLIGSNLTYTVTVTNHGPSDATGVTVRDFLPAGVSIVSATTSRGDCSVVGNIVICNLGNLATTDSAIATIVVTLLTTGVLNNRAGVTGDQADPNVANNTATQGTTANPAANLAVTMVDSPKPVLIGSNLTYTMTVTNHGPSDATGVTLTDTLSTSATFVSALPSKGSCSGTITIACTIGTLESGDTATVTITVVPNILGDLTTTTRVEATEADPDVGDNINIEIIEIIRVIAAADIRLSQVEGPGPIVLGNVLTYNLTVTNAGTSDASGVTLTNTLADGLIFDSAAPDVYGCAVFSGTVTCSLGSLASGESVMITIVVNTKRVGRIISTARVTADGMSAAASDDTTLDLSQFRFPAYLALLQPLGSSQVPSVRPTSIPTLPPTLTPTPVPPEMQPTPTPTIVQTGGGGSGDLIRLLVIVGVATGIFLFFLWRRRRKKRQDEE